MKSVLIGIPVLNNLEMTRACLQFMQRNTEQENDIAVSIVIIDNGSSEDIASMLRKDFNGASLPIYYRKNPRNLGVAIAWNQILRFSPENVPGAEFYYDYYVIANNDAFVGPNWLAPMIEAMESDTAIGWVATLENGSPLLPDLIEAHKRSREYRIDPSKTFTTERIIQSIDEIYSKWGGHEAFSKSVYEKLPIFIPFQKSDRSAVCFMVRPEMVRQIGYFDEEFWPIGVSEDLEYFLRMEKIIQPEGLTDDVYPADKKWKSGFCGKSLVHHNWCSTHQGKDFDGRKWDKQREKNWKKKFRKSKKYFTTLLP